MFDFRYHALSLVAVFLALGIGIVLGASLGDSVVSQANKDVRSSLTGDLINARKDARTATQAVNSRDAFINSAFPYIAGGALRGKRVAIVTSGGLPQNVESDVREAVKNAGGTVDSVSKLDAAPDLPDLGSKLGGPFRALGSTPGGQRSLTRNFARVLVRGGAPARRLRAALPDSFSGDFRGAGSVVYYHASVDRSADFQRFEAALVEGLRGAAKTNAVGVERSDTDPSQIPYYVNAGLSTVDDIEQPAGRTALALALAGAKGNFGFKSTADAPLPTPGSKTAGH